MHCIPLILSMILVTGTPLRLRGDLLYPQSYAIQPTSACESMIRGKSEHLAEIGQQTRSPGRDPIDKM